MSNIKDLFGKGKSNKIVSNSSLNEIGDPIESANYVKSKVKDIERFVPGVDFSTASNFAFYGLAENYYNDTINYIINEYPYDGSRQERLQWELNGTYLDRYFLENLYPRTNGFVNIGDSYGTVSAPTAGNFSGSSKTEYIKFYSGPNQADDYDGSQKISGYFDDANVFATGSRQEGNIDINGDKGFSVEFWLKKDGWSVSDESTAQVVLDVWNNSTDLSTRGQFTVYIDRTSPNQISYAITSGSVSGTVTLGSALPITGGDWNHYALTFENSGSEVNSKLYLNGELNAQTSSIGSIGPITGAVFGHLGSLTRALFAGGAGYGDTGYGKLSGSLDDFRLWKTARNGKEIQQNWFTNIYGGTNSDYQLSFSSSYKYDLSNNVDLGVYFKFNEGIISTSSTNSQDAVVLDYAGRSSNGAWTGYAVGARQTGSAMVLSNAALSEFKDPIIYAANPLVSSVKQEYLSKGIMHDRQNNSALYWSLPSWITSEDLNKSNSALKELTQIMSSYFDTLQMQIQSIPQLQENSYLSGNVKPLAFAGRLLDGKGLVSDEILSNATDLEYFASRNDKQNYEKKLEETKNLIYLNIYNNLTYIFKSKGTEKSFRNLIRCFGVDENIVNINLYGNNSDYELLDNTKNSIVRKRYVDFFEPSRFNATVYQSASSNTNTRSYISSSTEVGFHANTYECEAYFPNNKPASIIDSYSSNFLTSSVFGCHTSGSSEAWGSPDEGNFQVYSIRKALNRNEAFFKLTGTAGGFMPELTSSAYMDVYDDSKWNFSVRVYPSASFGNSVSEAPTSDYIVNFSGYEYVVDNLVNSFEVTGVISNANAKSFLGANKRFFVGAHRTNFTGSILEKSNAQVSSLRVWIDKLSEETLKTHAQKALNYGAENPYENITLSQDGVTLGEDTPYIPQEKTLALNWDFDTVTGSDASGQFLVPDYSSGSLSQTGSWGWMGDITEFQHTGYGFGFPANSTAVIDRKYVNTLIQKRPEVIDSQNMISLIDDSENQIFTQNTRPVDYFFAFEKSMYNVISQEILKVFATIKDFNNLIGAPVNRYRQDYKQLEKMRQLYFERVENVPDFDKFVEYYKWIDGSIASMLQQLAPASANFYDGLNNLVESHVLERNKYWTKFPTLDDLQPDPAAGAAGAAARRYPAAGTAVNIASPPNVNQSNVWYEKRLERTDPLITSGNPQVDQNREKIRKVVNQFVSSSGDALAESHAAGGTITQYRGNVYARRNFTKTVNFDSDQAVVLNGGTEFASSKRVDYTNDTIKFDSSNTLQVSAVSFVNRKPRVVLETTKTKVSAKVQNSEDVLGYSTAKTNIAAPFALFSSSVESGYVASFPSPFNNKGIENYHIDAYGPDSSTPVQGPFTDTHVGGRQYRHINVNTASTDNSSNRAEGWNLNLAGTNLTISSRTANQPRATMLRNETAKRPLNIANIKWGTSSANAGNYRFGYEILQASNRTLNDRYFVKAEGQVPANASSSYIRDLFDYELPRYDLTGTNKNIFVERFNAPGGPETNGGGLNVFGAEYSAYNTINYRNLTVRKSLNEWSQEHSGKFGIKSGSAISADGYNTLASYHKVNRNPRSNLLNSYKGYGLFFWSDATSVCDFAKNTNNTSYDLSDYNHIILNGGQPGTDNQCLPSNTRYILWFYVNPSASCAFDVNQGPPQTGFNTSDVLVKIDLDPTVITTGELLTQTIVDAVNTIPNLRAVPSSFNGVSPYCGGFLGPTSYAVKIINECVSCDQIILSGTVDETSCTTPFNFEAYLENYTGSCSDKKYDNFFHVHAIPQSACQYHWITSSIQSDCEQCCEIFHPHYDLFYPLGTSGSQRAPQLVFTPESYWGSYVATIPCGPESALINARVWGADSNTTASQLQFVPVDFVGLNSNIKEEITSSLNHLGYPSSVNLVSGTQCTLKQPSYLNTDFVPYLVTGSTTHKFTAQTFNSLMLHRNGPYQYPIWKQIRTGEHPVARYHKKRNILSISEMPKVINLPNGNGEGRPVEYRNIRSDSFRNFYEPPVEFKYKPLVTVANTLGATLNHSYGNNLGLFSQRGFGSQSVGTWLGIGDTKKNVQVYDKLKQIQGAVDVLNYNEVVYPRSSNTGFAKVRRRLNYAEDALRQSFDDLNAWSSYSGVIYNTGSNGVDRGPTERRTFWRDYYKNRNRRQTNWVRYDGLESYPYIVSSLPNSQEHNDGFGTSLYGLGNSPMLLGTLGSHQITAVNYKFSGSLKQTSYRPFYNTASNEAEVFLDFGELNSANYATIGSYYGSVINSDNTGFNAQTPANLSTQYPTASSYYYHFEVQKDNVNALSGASFSILNPGILRWRTAEFAGKNPWFDSYDDYSEDIARHAKNYTILPEFKISDHISYYIKNGGFKATNNQFLKLDGANITSSANSPTSNFNEQFFIEYSNSDFKQYFGNFSDDLGKPSSITLKCNAVKKLLPYNGFYPQQRSLQLASLFSQSLGPNISGLSWSAGSAVGTATYSGSLAMQAALQPYYAPGIMFNTIKSGIAVDWAAHIDEPSNFVTQSDKAIAEGYSHQFTSFIGTTSSYRIPFESIMDPLGGNYVPVSSSALNDKLYLLNPSLQGYAAPDAFYTSSIRNPYVNIRDQERRDSQKNNSEYQLYKMASQNFFAEVPNFFLENGQESGKLKSITSDVTDKDVTLESGSVYFMDIVLYKDQNLVMMEDYLNGSRDFPVVTDSFTGSDFYLTAAAQAPNEPLFPGDSYRSYNGRYFGPPVKADTTIDKDYKWGINDNFVSDPGFAPYTPPYFYGKSVATIRYVADGNDETRGGFSFEKMKNNCLRGVGGSSITYHNPDLDAAFNTLGSYQPWRKGDLVGIYTPRSIADTDRMNISSSLSIFGIKPIEQLRVDNLGNVEQQVGVYDSNKLVICPKMETPVLNFVNQSDQVWNDTNRDDVALWYPALTGRGMWSGYGAVPTSSSLNFGIERTKLDPSTTNTVDSSQMKSLVDVLFNGQEKTETVGELKGQKIISEAIVAIPFVENSYGNRSKFAYTVSVMKDKNFFGINKTVFRKVKEDYIKNRNNPEKELKPDSQSIQIMVERMSNYVMPPQLDFLNDTTISPFVAYIFEFNAQLDQEDLSDIWQGLMPKIATTAELSGLGTNELDKDGFGLDSFEFTHKTGKDEFYGGKELPCDIRWMVFKVKRRANYEYNKIRPDFNESAITPNNKKIKDGAVLKNPYSYNWPYDYFSLVELGQLEAQDNFVLSQGSGSIGTGRLPQFNFLGGGS